MTPSGIREVLNDAISLYFSGCDARERIRRAVVRRLEGRDGRRRVPRCAGSHPLPRAHLAQTLQPSGLRIVTATAEADRVADRDRLVAQAFDAPRGQSGAP